MNDNPATFHRKKTIQNFSSTGMTLEIAVSIVLSGSSLQIRPPGLLFTTISESSSIVTLGILQTLQNINFTELMEFENSNMTGF